MDHYIKKIFSGRRCDLVSCEGLAPSAVLLLLVYREKAYHVLFTKRSHHVPHHKGEISFPGGRRDSQDADLLCTALREGDEELGVRPEDVSILGRLDDVATTTTGFMIATYIGTIPYPYPFHVNHDEIADLFFVPLKDLCRQHQGLKSGRHLERPDPGSSLFRYKEHIIWGATARILTQFLTCICHEIL
jgi:8-oxo-dGTP pyrophosphatase MutT (NUDIX family)